MRPDDMLYFECLAGLAVAGFLVLVALAWRFLHRLDALVERLGKLIQGFEELLRLLNMSQRAEERLALEEGQGQAQGVDRFGRVTSLTREGAGGVWAALSKAAGSFLR